MVLMPHIKIEKPFQWANASTWKTNILGSCIAFWISFTLLGANLLVAEKVGKAVVPVIVLLFYLMGKDFTSFSGLIGRTVSRKTVLFIALALMTSGTIAIYFVNSIGMFALVYMLMAIGYFPAISITADLHKDFLSNDKGSRLRGRSFFGTLNYATAAFGAAAIPLISHGKVMVWFCISICVLLVAVAVLISVKDDVAVNEHPWKTPDRNLLPFFMQIIRVKSVNIPWTFVLVDSCSLAVRMCPVFFLNEWVAVAMIFCGEMTNAVCGLPQVRMSEWVDSKDTLTQKHIVQVVSLGTLITLTTAITLFQTGDAYLLIFGAILIGAAARVFAYLGLSQAEQTGRGAYTYFFIHCISHSLACMMWMVSLSLSMFLILLPFTLIGISFYARPLWRSRKG
jgi:MFS family permease